MARTLLCLLVSLLLSACDMLDTLNVSVTFDGLPKDKALTELAQLTRAAAAKHFKQEPEQLVLGFSVGKP